MNGLIQLWKTNAVIVAIQILVGIGLWFLPPSACPQTAFVALAPIAAASHS